MSGAAMVLLLESALWGSVVKIVGSSVWWVLVLVLVPVNSPVWSWHVGVLVGLWAGRWDSSNLGQANQSDLVLRLIRVKQSCMLALSECREALVRLVCLRPYTVIGLTSEIQNPYFQNEAKCTTFLLKISSIWMRMKHHFHMKGWAL